MRSRLAWAPILASPQVSRVATAPGSSAPCTNFTTSGDSSTTSQPRSFLARAKSFMRLLFSGQHEFGRSYRNKYLLSNVFLVFSGSGILPHFVDPAASGGARADAPAACQVIDYK